MGLSPFEVLNSPFDEVMQLYVDCIIHDQKEKQDQGNNDKVTWVNSKNATWH